MIQILPSILPADRLCSLGQNRARGMSTSRFQERERSTERVAQFRQLISTRTHRNLLLPPR